MIGLANYTGYGSMESPFTAAATLVFGNAAGTIVNFAAWIAAFTSLVGEIFCASRLLFGMAEDGVVPKVFAKLNKRHVPYMGLIFAYIIGVIIIIIGNVKTLDSFYVMIGTLACVVGTVCIIISVFSSLKYKSKFPEEWKNLPWHLPARNFMFAVAFLGCAVILYALFSSSPSVVGYSAIYILFLIAFYRLYSIPNIKKLGNEEGKSISNSF